MHRQARDRYGCHVDHARIDNAVPGDAALLREVVVERAEARQILGHEAVLSAKGVACPQVVAWRQRMINPDRSLVCVVMRIARVGVVVTVNAGSNECRLPIIVIPSQLFIPISMLGRGTYF